MRWLHIVFFCVCFALADGLPNSSSAAESRDLEESEIADWAAVGRLTFNRRSEITGFGCSATLIAPDVVITAAHCLNYAFDGAPSKVRQLVFQAGKFGDQAIATAKAESLRFHPSYELGGPDSFSKRIPYDLALVFLTSPLDGVVPIPLGPPPSIYELLDFVVYQGPASNPPRWSSECSHSSVSERILQVGCQVVGGNSGGGVIAQGDGDRRLVAVISATSGARALAVVPGEWLREELAARAGSN